jgi:hypothetical protein
MFRYLKGDRIIKAGITELVSNSFALAKLEYPFIQLKQSDEKDYMICGTKSCFSNTDNINELNSLIKNSL